MAGIKYTDEQKDALFRAIYSGIIHQQNLPQDLYRAIFDGVFKEVETGFVFDPADNIGREAQLMQSFSTNVSEVMAGKTFQQVSTMQGLVFQGGQQVSFDDFKKAASPVFDIYNKTWQKVEERTALLQSIGARNWVDVEADAEDFPLLEYSTAGDGRVRPEHAALDGIVRPVGDSFWNKYYPPNGWNCRCDVIQLEKGEKQVTPKKEGDWEINDVDPVFRMNPAKTGTIFQENHPYLDVPERFEEWKEVNFGLPILNGTED